MLFPKLSPLQSRLAASLIASVTLVLFYFASSLPHFAYASDVDSIRPEDHNHDRLRGPFLDLDIDFESSEIELREISYEPEFIGADRGIIGRAPTSDEPKQLNNNEAETDNVQMGVTLAYVFRNASVWSPKSLTDAFLAPTYIRKRQLEGVEENEFDSGENSGKQNLKSRQIVSSSYRTVYISATACTQPMPADPHAVLPPPPQLQLYVSLSANNTNPGPGKSPQNMIELDGGYGLYEVNATGDVFVGLYGKNDTAYTGRWSAQVAASIDAPFHYYHNTTDSNLSLIDSDSGAAYLMAGNPIEFDGDKSNIEKWSNISPPYVLFAANASKSLTIGLQNSYCGLNSVADILPSRPGLHTNSVQYWLTKRHTESVPRQKFYINGLAKGTNYNAVLAINGNSTSVGSGVVGGGGQVFQQMQFRTLSDSTCLAISNLSLCTDVTYSVPSNSTNVAETKAFYENYTQTYYANFVKAMAQIPCQTTSSAQYSLATNCSACMDAYRNWFCAVSIPRCTDFSSPGEFLQPRAIQNNSGFDLGEFADKTALLAFNSSRNPMIDQVIKPNPYKEILPCDDMCYNVVKNCPAVLGFTCPLPKYVGFNTSYQQRFQTPVDGSKTNPVQCNYMGNNTSGAESLEYPSRILMASALMVLWPMFI